MRATYETLRRKVYFALLQAAGGPGRLHRSLLAKDSLVVLNLHRVTPERRRFLPALCPRLFEYLLSFLVTTAHVVTFADLGEPERLRDDRVPVILSFDDGYKDFIEYAMPLLDRYGVRANQNVIPGCVLSGASPWSVRLWSFLAAAPPSVLSRIRLPGLPAEPNGSPVALETFGKALSAHLRSLPHDEREQMWGELQPLMDTVDVEPMPMMSLSDVREAAAVHELGAHSFSHDTMGLETKEFLQEDLRSCDAFFRERLGMPVNIYAFPHGSHTPEHVEVLAASGVDQILLVEEKVSNRHSVVHPRLSFGAVSRPEVRIRALGWTRERA
ncbi:MAG TPA: polysaccharide deacetylase family protein [Actinomycetota bacterium]